MFNSIFLSVISIVWMFNPAPLSDRAAGAFPDRYYSMMYVEPAMADHFSLEYSDLDDSPAAEVSGTSGYESSETSAGLGYSASEYYPEKFYAEYFYRDNSSQPIRDFRYYGVKTFKPNVERNNTVIRDFRTDLWK